jgi:predicted Zn-dependent peptidase
VSQVVVGLLVALAWVPAAAAAEPPSVGRYLLPEGLRLLVRDDPGAPVVAISLQVRSGTMYEGPTTAGLSHYVQRVMIRGTKTRSARRIIDSAEDLGGSLDASADAEHAEIRGTALAPHANALLELVADVALSPAFPPDEIERERRLILSQIQTRAETPFALALDTMTALLHGAHPLGLPVLGHKASVERFGREDLVSHYRRVYRASSMVIAVSGGVARDGIRREVERLFARTPPGAADEPSPQTARASLGRRMIERPLRQAHVLLGFPGPGLAEPDYAPGKLMSAILGGGMSGRLFARLRDARGLAYSLGMLNPSRRGPSTFVTYVATSADNLDRAEAALHEELERFRLAGPTDAELDRARAYVLGNLAMDRRTNARHAWYLAFFELAGVGWDYPERYGRALGAVTATDVTRVARRYLERPTTVVVKPPP